MAKRILFIVTFFYLQGLHAQDKAYAPQNCKEKAEKRLAFLTKGMPSLTNMKQDMKAEYAYNLASVYVFLNKDSAIYYFNKTIEYDPMEVEMLDDFFLKRISFSFTKYQLNKIDAAFKQTYNSRYADLIYEMLKMKGADQSIRQYGSICADDYYFKNVNLIDSQNLVKAKIIFNKYGFPTISMVGKEISNDYFLFIQHADRDVAFQKTVLKSLDTLFKKKEVLGEWYAYLKDRVMVAETGTQLYGTQYGKNGLFPIIDSSSVNQRRKEMGMGELQLFSK